MNSSIKCYEFAEFRLDATHRLLLRRDDSPVTMTPKAFDLLLTLVENRERVLTKDELLERVWADTIVEENNLSVNISTLRKALGERAHEHRFIVTVPGRGYKFVADVQTTNGTASNTSQITTREDETPPHAASPTDISTSDGDGQIYKTISNRKRLLLTALAASILLIIGVSLFWFVKNRGDEVKKVEISRTAQITTWSGLDFYPAISPDGNTVAFSSDRAGSFEIYVKQLVAGAKEVQITFDGAENFEPAFSPDGGLLAYYSNKRGGIWIVPLTGGTPKQLTEFGAHPAWSPDGKTMAFSNGSYVTDPGGRNALSPQTLWLVSAQGGEPRKLTQPNNPAGGHSAPAWSPDGRRIVFDTNDPSFSEVWSVSAEGDDLKKLSGNLNLATDAIYAPDGKAAFFVTGAGGSLWQVNLSPTGDAVGEPVKVFEASNSRIRNLSVAAKANRIVYSAMTLNSNLLGMSVTPSGDIINGDIIHLTQSTNTRNVHPAFSPDGKRIAYALTSASNPIQIWTMDADGKNQTQLTSGDGGISPSWFPDGKQIAFRSERDGQNNVSSVTVEGAKVRKLFDLDHSTNVVRLSPDGKQFAFSSTRNGGITNLWLISSEGSEPKQLTFDKILAGFPSWSPDGKWISFGKMDGNGTEQLAVVSSGGGEPMQLTFDKGQSWAYDWSPDGDKILFAGQRNGIWNIYWISRSTKQQKQLTNFTKLNSYVRYPVWSPLGNQIVYEYAETTGNIWLLELK